ncbi:LuxR C-terminal-related transcriptional regulator [Streptomyces sp. 7N604]|uniref:LuxR C-terminal-related transcriptional regulator n=1 Tax=Streptomyces sp. 7N604 TaxID=3457415 RepID=UPI003FD4311F
MEFAEAGTGAGTETGAAAVLAAAVEVIRAPLAEILPRLSAALAGPAPHHAVAELSSECTYAPFKTHGDPVGDRRITNAELAALAPSVPAGQPWQGRARVAGTELPVLAVSSDVVPRGALLVLVRTDDSALPPAVTALAQTLWDLVTAHRDRMTAEAVPGVLAQSRVAADTRARTIAELGDAHEATLTGLLGVLRSRALDDSTARGRAVDLAVSALVDLRAEAERDQALVEEPAGQAFERLADSLRPLLRHSQVRLDLAPPEEKDGAADRLLSADVANAARAVVRAVLLAVLEQGPEPVRRVHVGWKVDDRELHATVRDDGPGALSRDALAARRVGERLAALGGGLGLDAVPGWGTTVTVTVPLAPHGPQQARQADPLSALGARELEVLGHLARGHRNRAIAQELHISESTVKFHVANILGKLGVTTRGEAAALAHTWGGAAA